MKQAYIPKNPLFSGNDLKRLIFPLVVEQILAITVGMADTMMISSVGEAAVSGVSLVDMVNIIIINIFAAMATGGAVVTSQLIGAKREKEARASAGQLVLLCTSIAVAVMLLALSFKRPILHLFFGSIEQDVMDNALTYLVYSALSFPFLAIYNACAALFRAKGNSKISMKVSLWMNIQNLVGNALLIFVVHMGVAGAALSTLLSRIVAAALMLILITRPTDTLYLEHKFPKPDFNLMRRILRIGVPNGLENSFFQLGKVLVLSMISLFGTSHIAANAVANNLASLGCIPGQAINLAMITVVGRCIGAGDYPQATYFTKKLLKITYLCMAALNLSILLSLPLLLNIYQLSAETRRLAYIIILIHNSCAIFIWPVSFTLPNALRAANDVRFTMAVSIFSMASLRVAFSYVLCVLCGMGVVGTWIAMVLDWLLRATLFIWRMKSGKWKRYRFKTEIATEA